MKSVKYLLDLQKKTALNDTALGQLVGVSQAAISQYKNEKRIMDDETCIAVAMALDVHPMQVIGAACIDRAEKSGQKSLWEVFMNRGAAIAASVLIATSVNLFLTPAPANAATMRDTGRHDTRNIDYAKFCCRSKVVMSDSSNIEMSHFRRPGRSQSTRGRRRSRSGRLSWASSRRQNR